MRVQVSQLIFAFSFLFFAFACGDDDAPVDAPSDVASDGSEDTSSDTSVDGGPGAEVCDDGVDNNGNGLVDCADPTCAIPPPVAGDDATDATFFEQVSILLEDGACGPLQRDVEVDLDDPQLAVLTGQVTGEDGTPLAGARVSALDHPEFGWTQSRADGAFELAVVWMGRITLDVQADDHIEAQRTVLSRPRTYTPIADVELVRHGEPTDIDLSAGGVAVSAMNEDESGRRHATLLFPAGMGAQVAMADGSMMSIDALTVRPREVTVGDNGPARMMGTLPAASAYTYAIELDTGFDGDVQFDRPVPIYIDDFLDMPVGTLVPVGSYDRGTGSWVPEPNGLVVKILQIEAGRAVLDLDGDDVADDGDALAALGITEEELTQLASQHEADAVLWRFAPTHFSSWDTNWPFGFPFDAIDAFLELLGLRDTDADSLSCGSVIRVERQVLGESTGVVGTGMRLHYTSDRHQDYAGAREIHARISPDTIPSVLKEIRVELDVAGQRHEATFEPSRNLEYRHTWDGLDRFGARYRGSAPFRIRVGYVYDGVYRTGGEDDPDVPAFARGGSRLIRGSRTREEVVAWRHAYGVVHQNDVRLNGFMGLTLSAHHRFDSVNGILYEGNGDTRNSAGLPFIVDRVVGEGDTPAADGVPALSADTGDLSALAVGPDDLIYLAIDGRVFRVEEDETLTRIAGAGAGVNEGEGGPAIDASFGDISDLAFSPRGLLIASAAAERGDQIFVIADDGALELVAGSGEGSFLDDGDVATSAALRPVERVAVAPDGTIYVAHNRSELATVGADDVFRSVFASRGSAEEGTPMNEARLGPIQDLAFALDGTLIISADGKVYRFGPSRLLEILAGGGDLDPRDAFPAAVVPGRDLDLSRMSIAIALNGDIIAQEPGRVYRINPSGDTRLIGGRIFDWPEGNGGAATDAVFGFAVDHSVRADGSIVMAAIENPRSQVRRLSRSFGARVDGEWVVPSRDGSLRFIFDDDGLHLRTETALAGAPVLSFRYDGALLVAIDDADGNTITIERDGDTIVLTPPEGPTTRIADENSDGYADRIQADGDDQAVTLGWNRRGLLRSWNDQLGIEHRFGYDDQGRLISDGIAGDDAQTLVRDGAEVTLTTAAGRARSWTTSYLPVAGLTTSQRVDASGVATIERTSPSASLTTYANGSATIIETSPDAVLGGTVRVPRRVLVRTTSGAEVSWELEQEVEMEAATLRSRTWRATYAPGTSRESNAEQVLSIDASGASEVSVTSGEGRVETTALDERGKVTRVTRAGRHPITLTYDVEGRLELVSQGPPGEERELRYDHPMIPSRDFGDVTVSDATGREIRSRFDPVGREVELRDDVGAVGLSYDDERRRYALTPPDRGEHVFQYDDRGFLEEATPPSAAANEAQTFVFDDDGVQEIETIGGETIRFETDDAFRPSQVDLGEGRRMVIEHDDNGDLESIAFTQRHGTVGVALERDAPLITEVTFTGALAAQLRPAYNDALEMSGLTVAAGGTEIASTYEFNDDSQVTQATIGAETISLRYDRTSGDLTRVSDVGTTTNYRIDGFGGMEEAEHTFPGGSFQRTYGYDRGGRINTVEEDGTRFGYDYDTRGRLTEVTTDGATTHTYDFDTNGNRVTWNTPAGSCASDCVEVDDQDRLRRYGRGADALRFDFHPSGRVASRTSSEGTREFAYDPFGHLEGVTLEDGTEVHYVYDPNGNRVAREVDGARTDGYVWSGSLMVGKLDASGELLVRYLYLDTGWTPSHALHRDGRLFRVISDQVGSVRLVVNADTGAIAQRYAYSPFGVFETEVTTEDIVPHRYAGGLYDPATEIYRFGARDYDPVIGRWLAKDPISFSGGDANLYGYVGQDPINYVDPSGRNPLIIIGGIAGALGNSAVYAGTHGHRGTAEGLVGAAAIGLVNGALIAATGANPIFGAIVGGALGALRAGFAAGLSGDCDGNFAEEVATGAVAGAVGGFVGRSIGIGGASRIGAELAPAFGGTVGPIAGAVVGSYDPGRHVMSGVNHVRRSVGRFNESLRARRQRIKRQHRGERQRRRARRRWRGQ